MITIQGTNLPNSSPVYIGNVLAQIISASNSQILIKSPSLAPGIYKLIIPAGENIGNVKYF